jgi:hypothetical protein
VDYGSSAAPIVVAVPVMVVVVLAEQQHGQQAGHAKHQKSEEQVEHCQHQLLLSSQESPPLLSLCEQLSKLLPMMAPMMNASPADMPPCCGGACTVRVRDGVVCRIGGSNASWL